MFSKTYVYICLRMKCKYCLVEIRYTYVCLFYNNDTLKITETTK